MFLRSSIATLACTVMLAAGGFAQEPNHMDDMPHPAPITSPAATATVDLNGKNIKITYNAPSMRGRKIMGGLVPYDKVWRTGANPATTLITKTNLKIGTLTVPAGTYTLFTLPSTGTWQLIVSKKTKEWGIPYPEGDDLGRTSMTSKPMSEPQEKMSISFENTSGNHTELHIKWENTDEYVDVTAE